MFERSGGMRPFWGRFFFSVNEKRSQLWRNFFMELPNRLWLMVWIRVLRWSSMTMHKIMYICRLVTLQHKGIVCLAIACAKAQFVIHSIIAEWEILKIWGKQSRKPEMQAIILMYYGDLLCERQLLVRSDSGLVYGPVRVTRMVLAPHIFLLWPLGLLSVLALMCKPHVSKELIIIPFLGKIQSSLYIVTANIDILC